jgi:hypothetical protein
MALNNWACSSVVERFVDIEEVISSILITPTIIKEQHIFNGFCEMINLI